MTACERLMTVQYSAKRKTYVAYIQYVNFKPKGDRLNEVFSSFCHYSTVCYSTYTLDAWYCTVVYCVTNIAWAPYSTRVCVTVCVTVYVRYCILLQHLYFCGLLYRNFFDDQNTTFRPLKILKLENNAAFSSQGLSLTLFSKNKANILQ